jgi:hypothetical protein
MSTMIVNLSQTFTMNCIRALTLTKARDVHRLLASYTRPPPSAPLPQQEMESSTGEAAVSYSSLRRPKQAKLKGCQEAA